MVQINHTLLRKPKRYKFTEVGNKNITLFIFYQMAYSEDLTSKLINIF